MTKVRDRHHEIAPAKQPKMMYSDPNMPLLRSLGSGNELASYIQGAPNGACASSRFRHILKK